MFTITFGDVCENHAGMQRIGSLDEKGFSYEDLVKIQESLGGKIINLHDKILPEAYVLVIPNGLEKLVIRKEDLHEELKSLEWDTKAYMYGRVVNKKARYNLCFANDSQEPDYKNGKGRIISFSDTPNLKIVKSKIESLTESKFVAEGNWYYDLNKCGIGYHGDSERRKVVAVRIGGSCPIYFQWYHHRSPIGSRISIPLEDGDIYVMSEKAVGTDWKRSSVPTLRHATGCDTFTN